MSEPDRDLLLQMAATIAGPVSAEYHDTPDGHMTAARKSVAIARAIIAAVDGSGDGAA